MSTETLSKLGLMAGLISLAFAFYQIIYGADIKVMVQMLMVGEMIILLTVLVAVAALTSGKNSSR